MKLFILALTGFLALGNVQAEVVVVVAKSSTAPALTQDNVSQVFMGKGAAVAGYEQAVVLDLVENDPIRAAFYQDVMGKSGAQMKAYWSKVVFTGKGQPPKMLPNTAELKKAIAADPKAVGYVNREDVDGTLKVVYPAK